MEPSGSLFVQHNATFQHIKAEFSKFPAELQYILFCFFGLSIILFILKCYSNLGKHILLVFKFWSFFASACCSALIAIFLILSFIYMILFVVDTSDDEAKNSHFSWSSFKRMLIGCVPVISLIMLCVPIFKTSIDVTVECTKILIVGNTVSDTPESESTRQDKIKVSTSWLVRTICVLMISAARPPWGCFLSDKTDADPRVGDSVLCLRPLSNKHFTGPPHINGVFILFLSAHASLIGVMLSQAAKAPVATDEGIAPKSQTYRDCVLTAMNALSPFFEHLAFSGASGIPNARDSVFILWHVLSFSVVIWFLSRSVKNASLSRSVNNIFVLCAFFALACCGYFLLQYQHPLPWHLASLFWPSDSLPHIASTTLISWCLWFLFITSQVFELHKRAAIAPPNTYSQRFILFLGHAVDISNHVFYRKLPRMFVWIAMCSFLFYTLFQANTDDSDFMDIEWRVNGSKHLLVNMTAMWPIPYAILHAFPNPSGLVSATERKNTDPSTAANQTPIVCSIDIHG
jgi:hypothetical protein